MSDAPVHAIGYLRGTPVLSGQALVAFSSLQRQQFLAFACLDHHHNSVGLIPFELVDHQAW